MHFTKLFALAAVASATFLHKARVGTTKTPLIGKVLLSGKDAAVDRIVYSVGKKVLTGDVNLYLIYYGEWTEAQKKIVNDFANGLGASSWYGSTKEYYYQASATAKKIYVNGALKVAKVVSDVGSLGNSLTGTAIGDLIQSNVDSGALPEDENGIYFVLTSPEIKESIRPELGTASFCQDYCGYHVTSVLKSGKRVQYGMVGNAATQCADSCIPTENQSQSPNGDVGVDALLSGFAHEITEAISDPISDINDERAWNDSQGAEVFDCFLSDEFLD